MVLSRETVGNEGILERQYTGTIFLYFLPRTNKKMVVGSEGLLKPGVPFRPSRIAGPENQRLDP